VVDDDDAIAGRGDARGNEVLQAPDAEVPVVVVAA
jgi:hypothetical protein